MGCVMFLLDKSELSIFLDEEFQISNVKLVDFSPFLVLEVLELKNESDGIVFRKPFILADIRDLQEFARKSPIDRAFIVRPNCLNGSSDWSVDRLKKVSRAKGSEYAADTYLYRMEFVNGSLFDYDESGLVSLEPILVFEQLIQFN